MQVAKVALINFKHQTSNEFQISNFKYQINIPVHLLMATREIFCAVLFDTSKQQS